VIGPYSTVFSKSIDECHFFAYVDLDDSNWFQGTQLSKFKSYLATDSLQQILQRENEQPKKITTATGNLAFDLESQL